MGPQGPLPCSQQPAGCTHPIHIFIRLTTCTHFSSLPSNDKVSYKVKLYLCFNRAPRPEGVLGSGGIAPRIP